MRIHQVFGHHRSLCQFTQVEDHTLALSNEVKVSTEGICELLQWMGGSGHRCIFQTLLCDNLLTSFHSHFDEWHQGLVLCQAHLSLPDNKPFAACPGPFLVRELRPVKHAQHASYWHFILTKGQLLQEVVGLEHDITNTGSGQPAGLIHLLLWSLLQVLRVNRVQGEQGLPGCSLAHLQGQEQILQVHSSCWLQGGCDLHSARCFIQHQAAHAPAGGLTAQTCCQWPIRGDTVHAPANVILLAAAQFLLILPASTSVLLALSILHQDLGHALGVNAASSALPAFIGKLPNWHQASSAQRNLLTIRVHCIVRWATDGRFWLCCERSFNGLFGCGSLRCMVDSPREGLAIVARIASRSVLSKLLQVLLEGLLLLSRRLLLILLITGDLFRALRLIALTDHLLNLLNLLSIS